MLNEQQENDELFSLSIRNLFSGSEKKNSDEAMKREITERMVHNLKSNKFFYTTRHDKQPEIWLYKNGIYVPEGRTYIKEFCREVFEKNFTTQLCNEIIAKIEADTYIDQKDFFINEEVNLIPVQNGVLNLKTKELLQFSPQYRFFNKLPASYLPDSDCPVTKHFLKEVLENNDDIIVLQELLGYLLYRDYKIEKAFMFTGTGRNGKSKTLELMKRFIGPENCANITLEDMEKDQYAASELFNKLANLSADISKTALKRTGTLKNLTGHDLVSAARKYLTRIHFQNYAKLIFCANELPKTYDDSAAFWNRWIWIDFPYQFLPENEMEGKNEEELRNVKIADPGVIDRITTQEELNGLLIWSLEGLERLRMQGNFSTTKKSEYIKLMWYRKSDSLAAFFNEMIEDCSGKKMTKADFKTEYQTFCKLWKIQATGDKRVKKFLAENGVLDKVENNVHFWLDIRLKSEFKEW